MSLPKLLPNTSPSSFLKQRRLTVACFALGALSAVFCAAPSWAENAQQNVDVHQLHLPRSYFRYLPAMLDGARLMAADEHCVRFLSGDLNIDQSTPEQPVFRYQCRGADDLTYRWHVDGKSLEVIDATRPSGRISFAALTAEYEQQRELARQQAAERQAKIDQLQRQRQEVAEQKEAERLSQEQEQALRQEQARRQRLWQTCQVQLAAETSDMIERRWLTTTQPEPEVSDTGVRFSMDFDARDQHGVALKYRVYCDAGPEGETVTLSIHPRALAP